MDIQAVIFDMDGVIFDSERCCLELWKEMAGERGLDDIERNFYKCIGTTAEATKQILRDSYGANFDAEGYMREASVRFHERYDDGKLPVLPFAEELLAYLKREGFKLGLASSTREATVRRQLSSAGLIDYFDTITCGDMLKKSKPEPDIYLMACERTGVAPENAVAIEDSYNGVRSAYRAGMIPFMVPDLIPDNDEMRSIASRIFKDLGEVMNWFKSERSI